MEELLKALAEAVRAGTSLAYPAIIGYFIVRTTETLVWPLSIFILVRGVAYCIQVSWSSVASYERKEKHLDDGLVLLWRQGQAVWVALSMAIKMLLVDLAWPT